MVDQNVPNSNPPFDSIYNPSGFDGQVLSDFMRLGGIPPALRKDLIDFSTADFDQFKESFLDYIKAVYPNDFNNFYESDLGIMLAELFAYMSAVLSFKADAIAQENYIATAKTDESVLKLLQLIGVSLRGPVCAKANGTLTIQDTAYAVTGGGSITLSLSERMRHTTSTRDNLPLTYTIYKVASNGNIDMLDSKLVLDEADSTTSGTVFPNLVLLEGEAQVDTGTFSTAAATSQFITLSYPSVIEGSIFVSSSDGIYSEIESIWFASGDQKVFEKVYLPDFSCKLLFGNGSNGKPPVAGTPYSVYYRTGGGLRGNVARDVLNGTIAGTHATSAGGTTSQNMSLEQTRAGTGGSDSESVEEVKRIGPMWFATQYRAVTGKDYTTFINRFTSTAGKTGKGLAVLRDNGSAGNMIDLYVLQKSTGTHLERASFEFKKELIEYLEKYRMLTDELTVVDGVVRTLDLVCTLYLDSFMKLSADDTRQRIAGLITKYFDTTNLDFGTPLLMSDIINFVLKDEGVRFFSIDNYKDDIYVDFNELIQLNNVELNVQFV